jgi:anti-anti-sigma factor
MLTRRPRPWRHGLIWPGMGDFAMNQSAGSRGFKHSYPVRWAGRQAVVVLPEHIGQANAGQVSEELLSVINRGADALIVDMTATISCDYTGADALLRARQRAVASGTQLRLVVTDRIVRRALGLSGLNHLISIYPSLEAAVAAREPTAAAGPQDGDDDSPAVTPEVLRGLLDALDDGVALADRAGALVLASRRLEEMFGYQHAELLGRRVDSLLPGGPRGARKDGSRFPVEVRSIPVHTLAAQFTLTVVRDVTGSRPAGPAGVARAAAGDPQARDRDLAASVIASLSRAELSLRSALESSRDAAGPRIVEALHHLTAGLREIRGIALAASRQGTASRHTPPDGARAASGPQADAG